MPRLGHHGVRIDAALLEDRPDDALFFARQGDQQVQRMHRLVAARIRDLLRLLQRLLSFLRKFIEPECHKIFSPSN